MNRDLFVEFMSSGDTLRVYRENERVFSSNKGMLFPLLEYISRCQSSDQKVIVLDKVVGNAAGLLAVRAGAAGVQAAIASELAIHTFEKYKIEYYVEKIVPFILAANTKDMCPMEKLSLNMNPQELYDALKEGD